MKKYTFQSNEPFSEIDIEKATNKVSSMSKRELRESTKQNEYLQLLNKQDRNERKSARHSWWKNNWISFLSLIFAFIAALPVIWQIIAYILTLLT